jgi:hypothetical protein
LRDEIGPLVDDMNLIDIWEAYLARPKEKANEPRIHEHSKQEKAYFKALHKEIPELHQSLGYKLKRRGCVGS